MERVGTNQPERAGERLALVLRRIAGVETRDRPPEHDLRARIDYLERDAGEMRMRALAG